MDGARGVRGSVGELISAALILIAKPLARPRGDAVRLFRRRGGWRGKTHRILIHPLTTGVFVFGLMGGVAAYSVDKGGAYARFIQDVGTPGDLLARAFGMGVESVTISGLNELREGEVLESSGVKARNSLPYLDAVAIRARLMSIPLVRDAEVRKLYPNRLMITIFERQPFALWQQGGKFYVVAADGVVLSELNDARFVTLPVIVGDGANERMEEYSRILTAAGDLASRVKAGSLISRRRWTLYTREGVEIRLPEQDPVGAVAQIVRLQRERRLLDKDVAIVDARAPGRLVVRMSEEAAARRLEAAGGSPKGKV